MKFQIYHECKKLVNGRQVWFGASDYEPHIYECPFCGEKMPITSAHDDKISFSKPNDNEKWS